MPMRKVTLHGELAQFGGPYKLDVQTAAEAVYALVQQFPPAFLRLFLDGSYFVEIKNKPMEALDELVVPGKGDIDIYPAILAAGGGGGKGKSIGMIVAGTILVGAAIIATGGVAGFAAAAGASTFGGLALSAAASIGTGLILTGVTGLLSPVPKMAELSTQREQGKTNSFLYHGPVNRDAEGGAVPLVYGRCIVGSIRIAGGTVVTSAISEGRQYIDLGAVPIGDYAFNFNLVPDTVISEGGGVELFVWERKDKSTFDTLWDWEIRVSWDGGEGSNLPNENYLKTSLQVELSNGETHYGGFSNDDFYSYNGPILRTHRFEIEGGQGLIIGHRALFRIEGNSGMDIQLNSFYSRLKRVA